MVRRIRFFFSVALLVVEMQLDLARRTITLSSTVMLK